MSGRFWAGVLAMETVPARFGGISGLRSLTGGVSGPYQAISGPECLAGGGSAMSAACCGSRGRMDACTLQALREDALKIVDKRRDGIRNRWDMCFFCLYL